MKRVKRLACLLLLLGGCVSFDKVASDAAVAAADQVYDRIVADLPEPAPEGGSEEMWVAVAGALALVVQRYWYRWRAKPKTDKGSRDPGDEGDGPAVG